MPIPNPCILAVDDDVQVLHLVRRSLLSEGYQVITANCGESAVAAFEQHLPDLVLLDVMMPGIDGYIVCQRIRSVSHVPIIMLTAMGSDDEKVRGLDAGADDYVTKPFSLEVLLARIRAVLRRSQDNFPPASCEDFKNDSLEINFASRRVTVAGNEIRLTPTEFHLLQEMVINAGKVLPHTHLLNKVWGQEYRDEREYLHVFVRSLRTKLKLDRQGRGSIDNISGVGYRFNA
jgi:DNA-binding response OmpR family regulator